MQALVGVQGWFQAQATLRGAPHKSNLRTINKSARWETPHHGKFFSFLSFVHTNRISLISCFVEFVGSNW